jgi:anti-sigma B factor antagonist
MTGGTGLTVTVTDGDPVLVTVAGELDLVTAAELAGPLRQLIVDRRPSAIDVDLVGLGFMDSTGIQVLVAAHADAAKAGIPLRVRAASAPVLRVLGMTGLLDALGLSGEDSNADLR